jgi:hypothetical protein
MVTMFLGVVGVERRSFAALRMTNWGSQDDKSRFLKDKWGNE